MQITSVHRETVPGLGVQRDQLVRIGVHGLAIGRRECGGLAGGAALKTTKLSFLERVHRDVSLVHDFPQGGWCPKGRKSLEGSIPARYRLTETPSASYLQRTEWNVRDSDGTVVFTLAPEVTGGSLRTIGFARKHDKPCLHLSQGVPDAVELLLKFIGSHGINTLNVAGSRESKEPGIHEWVSEVLSAAFFRGEGSP